MVDRRESPKRKLLLNAINFLSESVEKNGCIGFSCSDCAAVDEPKSCPAVDALDGLREVLKDAPPTSEALPLDAWTGGADDQPLPEDDAIKAAHPTRSERHDLFAEAMRFVGARRSKYGLVGLVTWLLQERDKALGEAQRHFEKRRQARTEAIEECAKACEAGAKRASDFGMYDNAMACHACAALVRALTQRSNEAKEKHEEAQKEDVPLVREVRDGRQDDRAAVPGTPQLEGVPRGEREEGERAVVGRSPLPDPGRRLEPPIAEATDRDHERVNDLLGKWRVDSAFSFMVRGQLAKLLAEVRAEALSEHRSSQASPDYREMYRELAGTVIPYSGSAGQAVLDAAARHRVAHERERTRALASKKKRPSKTITDGGLDMLTQEYEDGRYADLEMGLRMDLKHLIDEVRDWREWAASLPEGEEP